MASASKTAVASESRITFRIAEVARRLGISRRLIERHISAGTFPKPDARIGRCGLWRPETLDAWIASGGAK